MKKENSLLLKGIAIIAVILSHYGQYYLGVTPINQLGAIGCAIFFFCSGYGLSFKIHEPPMYFIRKIISIYSTFMLANMVFIVLNCLNGVDFTVFSFILSLIGYSHIFICDWFIFVLIYFLIALLICSIFKKINPIVLCVIIGVLYTGHSMHFNNLSWLCFPVGLFFNSFQYKDSRYLGICCLLLFVTAYSIQAINNGLCDTVFRKVLFIFEIISLSSICFCFSSIILDISKGNGGGYLGKLIRSGIKPLVLLGDNSLFLYLMQGAVFYIFTNSATLSPLIAFVLLFPTCLILAFILKLINKRIKIIFKFM